MANRTVGGALLDIVARIARGELKRLTLDGLREGILASGDASPWVRIERIIGEDVQSLTLSQYLLTVGCIREFVIRDAGQRNEIARTLVKRFATAQNTMRTLTDHDTLLRMARIEPVSIPSEPPSELDRIGQFVRTGHAESTPHWELTVSSQLFGARLTSYFYLSGETIPNDREEILPLLVAHDSDEVVIYLGFADPARAADSGILPIYLDGHSDPYERVKDPIELKPNQFFIYDGANPHYWFGPEKTVALFVSASPNQTFRKPVAFRSENRDSVPGGSYLLFETRRRRRPKKTSEPAVIAARRPRMTDERASYLIGKRLRRKRDGYGLSAKEIEKLKTRSRGVNATVIGKIENNALSNVHLQLIMEYAEALDLPITELFPREPLKVSGGLEFSQMRSPAADAEQGLRPFVKRPYAVVPQLLPQLPSPAASGTIHFYEGEADVVLLPLEGAVEVYVAPDPLLLALELVHYAMSDHGAVGFETDSDHLRISEGMIDRLKRRQLLYQDHVEARQAYQFNAALLHAVVAAPGSTPKIIAVTTRGDIHLPAQWLSEDGPEKAHRPSARRAGGAG